MQDETQETEDIYRLKEIARLPLEKVVDILVRKKEREIAKQPGRPKDMHKEMAKSTPQIT